MRNVLVIGCGDIALRTIPLLTPRYKVFALIRNPEYRARLRMLGATPIMGNLDDRHSLARIAGIAEAVLHFAPPPNDGVCDLRTRNMLNALSHVRKRRAMLPKRIVYISTSGVYGDCDGAWVNETRPLNAKNDRALRRVDAEQQVRSWARRNRVKASILRVPGIYAADRLPLGRIKRGSPCIAAVEDSYTNHIHADDLARISIAALQRGKPCRIYHASDDSQLKMGEYFDQVADAFNLRRMPRISRAEAQTILSPMLLSFMNESRRLTNDRLKHELKVILKFRTVQSMLLRKNIHTSTEVIG
ncbi:MAG: SDR family oxidoreductase [Gallionella sp.]